MKWKKILVNTGGFEYVVMFWMFLKKLCQILNFHIRKFCNSLTMHNLCLFIRWLSDTYRWSGIKYICLHGHFAQSNVWQLLSILCCMQHQSRRYSLYTDGYRIWLCVVLRLGYVLLADFEVNISLTLLV